MTPLLFGDVVVRRHTTDPVYAHPLQIVQDERIVDFVRRGNDLEAAVWGSDLRPYRVRIRRIEGHTVGDVECTCPCAFEGWCEHAAAVLLSAIGRPRSISERPPMSDRLGAATPDRLYETLLALADAHPELTDEIEARLTASAPSRPTGPSRAGADGPSVHRPLTRRGRSVDNSTAPSIAGSGTAH